jgi:simple sugar transport system ATP-binding protein
VLSLSHISKHFGRTHALDDVSFDVGAGEVHALLGENGAGKTTLMRIAYGMLPPDVGEIVIRRDSQEVRRERIASPFVARALGIGMVHQHFTSIEAFTVAENIALAAGWRGGSHQQRAAEVSARLALPLDATARARDLSVQLRQRLEIVQALASDARILLLDEPTAVLAPREVVELLDLVRRFRDQGGAVVLISHKLADVAQVADRITVLRRGQVTLSGAARQYDAAALSRAMIGTDPASHPAVDRVPIERRGLRGAARPDPEREIRVALQEPGILLHAGEIVGIAAIEGNGQRELLRAIGGLRRMPAVEVTGSVAFVPEDRSREALIPAFSLTANLLLGNLDRASCWIDWSRWQRETAALLERHDVRAGGVTDSAASLSGGNQQKFIIARALARRPDVLVVEHPTRGLDVTATAATRSALREAAASGSCVVIHDADLDEVLALATRLLVISNGVVRELAIDTPRAAVGDAMLGLA